MKKVYAIVAIVLAVCLTFALAGCGSDEKTSSTASSGANNTAGKPRFGLNEETTINGVTVKFNSFKKVEGNDKAKPAEGNEFVLFDFTIKNGSTSDINIVAMHNIFPYADGKVMKYNILAQYSNTEKPYLDGSIKAGAELNGGVVFEAPKDWKMIEIHVKPEFWSSKDIIFVANQ